MLSDLRKQRISLYAQQKCTEIIDELDKMRDELRKSERTDYKRCIKRADILLRNLGSKQHWINGVLNDSQKDIKELYCEFTEFFS